MKFADKLDNIFSNTSPVIPKKHDLEMQLLNMIQTLEKAQTDLFEIESKAAALSLSCSNLQDSIESLRKEIRHGL